MDEQDEADAAHGDEGGERQMAMGGDPEQCQEVKDHIEDGDVQDELLNR